MGDRLGRPEGADSFLLEHIRARRQSRLSCQCCDLGFWKYSSTACSVSYHTCCTIFGNFKYFRAVCPAFFFAIRICGLGLWPDSTTACPMSYYTCCTSSSFHFLSGVMPCGQGIPYIQSQCCIAALRKHISNKISEIRNLAVGHTMSNAPDLF